MFCQCLDVCLGEGSAQLSQCPNEWQIHELNLQLPSPPVQAHSAKPYCRKWKLNYQTNYSFRIVVIAIIPCLIESFIATWAQEDLKECLWRNEKIRNPEMCVGLVIKNRLKKNKWVALLIHKCAMKSIYSRQGSPRSATSRVTVRRYTFDCLTWQGLGGWVSNSCSACKARCLKGPNSVHVRRPKELECGVSPVQCPH